MTFEKKIADAVGDEIKRSFGPKVELIRQRIEELNAERDMLRAALKRAHACATLRDDGTCDGCFVSEALKERG